MQRLTPKMTTTSILFVFFLASAHADGTVAVPGPLSLRPNPATIQFVKAYAAYAIAVRDHGVEGVKQFTTPDFVLRSPGASSHGDKAYKELSACIDCFHGDPFTATIHPLFVTGTDTVALSEETYAFHTKLRNQNMAGSVIECWKETWRKTAQGWKLASMEADREDFDKVPGVAFTVLTDAQIELAKAQEKQNVVK